MAMNSGLCRLPAASKACLFGQMQNFTPPKYSRRRKINLVHIIKKISLASANEETKRERNCGYLKGCWVRDRVPRLLLQHCIHVSLPFQN
ncbi:hypothetical protein XELAEV_18012882mg [Xenopus laevis]|uniref:Uncharacterized protein n=1 Tax=Xenopus laevis TaxID=8355 RepID=A0A974DNY7_XENLA|nr:hypothetical protein XELAEV_18012882mg [Xenopus laevis]